MFKKLFEKVDEFLLPNKEETLYYIELVVVAVLTDSQNLESERVQSKQLLHTFLDNFLDNMQFDLVYQIFDRKLKHYENDEGDFYNKKQEIIEKIIKEKRVLDAEILTQIYKSDGFIQKEERDVLKRLEKIKEN